MRSKHTLLFLIFLIFLIVTCTRYQKRQAEIHRRADLAVMMGLDPKIYSQDPYFPENYFYDALEPGMSIDQVHQIIRGYVSVYSCGNYELYYFFSESEEEGVRFAAVYDRNKDVMQKKLVKRLNR